MDAHIPQGGAPCEPAVRTAVFSAGRDAAPPLRSAVPARMASHGTRAR